MSTPPPTGYPPPPGWQPPGQPPQPSPPQRTGRFRRGCLYVILSLVGLFIVIGIVGVVVGVSSNGTKTGTTTTKNSSGGTVTHTAGIGNPVRDGKFQFTVTKVTQAHRVGDQFLHKTAQGEYTILHITVTNIGNVAQTLDDSAQYVYDARGRQFSADSEADIYLNNNDQVFLNNINPGNTVHGKIAFDLPVGDTAVRAELHDSMFSGGVTVSLR